MKIAYFDCANGVSGDMFVGALLDLGVDVDELRGVLSTLPVDGWTIEARKVHKKGLLATQFMVHTEKEDGMHSHRHLGDIVEIIKASQLPEEVKESAIRTFHELAQAESEVHGTTIENIHFHEVGAVDAIIDIVSAHWCWWRLGIEKAFCSTVHLGGGTVESAHGILPVPAPAVTLLLKDFEVVVGGVDTELTTPTGAVLLKVLSVPKSNSVSFTLKQIGIGAGSKDLPHRSNVFRILLGEMEDTLGEQPNDTVCVVETNIDDMSGELIAPVIEELLNSGAKDAFFTPVWCKKGRPGVLLTVLCDVSMLPKVREVLFMHTSTFGVRFREEKRFVLQRKWVSVDTPWGVIQVKVGFWDEKVYQVSPEYETCHQLAKEGKASLIDIYNFIQKQVENRQISL